MKGEALKCDNCGELAFYEYSSDAMSTFKAFLMSRHDDDEEDEEESEPPSSWFFVQNEELDEHSEVIRKVRHFCSIDCLQFAVSYTYGKKQIPTINEGE